MKPNKTDFAQFFTPPSLATRMANLVKNSGRKLEPSCGNGALVDTLIEQAKWTADSVAIEFDSHVAPVYAIVQDFFAYPLGKFASVVMNPPYLAGKNIPKDTKDRPLFKQLEAKLGGYANLYSYFVLKSFFHLEKGGEIVAVVPDDVFRATGNAKLNSLLHNNGTFTDIIKFKKSPFLPEASQDVLVFRYEHGNMSHKTKAEVV